jgi:hypothetical protein
VTEFRNLYLLAGLRGGFEQHVSIATDMAAFSMLRMLDDGWGVTPPWGACDSGADLETEGDDVLRGWAHVDLRTAMETPTPNDVALAGPLRTMWDALELYGKARLTGADAIVPLECVGDSLWRRVAGSVLRSRAPRTSSPARVLVQAASAWSDSSSQQLDHDQILRCLSEFVEVAAAMDSVPFASYPPSLSPTPFTFGFEHPWGSSDTDPFRAESLYPSGRWMTRRGSLKPRAVLVRRPAVWGMFSSRSGWSAEMATNWVATVEHGVACSAWLRGYSQFLNPPPSLSRETAKGCGNVPLAVKGLRNAAKARQRRAGSFRFSSGRSVADG